MIEQYCDLHHHPTKWSMDGSMSPSGAVEFWYDVKRNDLNNAKLAVGITEHDHTISIEPLVYELEKKNRDENISPDEQIEPVFGVEATGQWSGYSMHMLGYWLPHKDESNDDLINYMLRAQRLLRRTNLSSYNKYGNIGLGLVVDWAIKKGHSNANLLTTETLEKIRDASLPHIRDSYKIDKWRIGPYDENDQPRISGLNHMHLATAMSELGWVSLHEAKNLVDREGELYVSKRYGFEAVPIEDVVRELYESRCLVVMAHPQELMYRMIADRLGGMKLERVPGNDEGINMVNNIIEEIKSLIVNLIPHGLRGLELLNRFSYIDGVFEYTTQKLYAFVQEFNEKNKPGLLISAGSDNHKGHDDKRRPLAKLHRQLPSLNERWFKRQGFTEHPDNTPFEDRVELHKPIEYSFLAKMKNAELDNSTGLYLLPKSIYQSHTRSTQL